MKSLVYVDPQSYRNLAVYDYSLLKGMGKYNVVYCCNKKYDGPKLDNVDVRPIFTYRQEMNPLVKIVSYVWSLLKLVSVLKTERPNVLHIQWWRQWNIDYVFLSLYKRYSGQVVFTAHNLLPHDSGESMKRKCIKYYNKVDKIIVHDNSSKDILIEELGIKADKIAVIAHGVLKFSIDKADVRKIVDNYSSKYRLEGKLIFAAMGVQSYYKGTDLVRDAFLSSSFLKNNSDTFLIIAGQGDIVTQESFADCSNVLVVNYSLSDSEFQAIMVLADVVLLPYRKISQSGVLLTAIQNQVPFAVTHIGGLTDPLNTAPVGWIISDISIEGVRDCMEKLVRAKSATKAVKFNQRNWNLVKEKYDWREISNQTMTFYEC